MISKKYWDKIYRLRKFLELEQDPIKIDQLIDLLNFKSVEEFVNFFVESSLTSIDIDWSNKTVFFSKNILEELDKLLTDFDLSGLFGDK